MKVGEELILYWEREPKESVQEDGHKKELFFSLPLSLNEVRIGVDIGYHKSYGALVVRSDGVRYLLEGVVVEENALFGEALLSSVSRVGGGIVVVEDLTSRPLKGRMRWKEWRKLKKIRKNLIETLRSARLPVVSSRAVRGDAWYGGGAPGWRQRLTGLTRPSERDIFHYLMNLKRCGRLIGHLPSNENLVDAVGMAVWAFEYPFTPLRR